MAAINHLKWAAPLSICLAFGTAGAQENLPACEAENSRSMDITEFLEPLPADQPIGFILHIDENSDLYAALQNSGPEALGALINEKAPDGVRFDPDVGEKLAENLPLFFGYACMDGKITVIDAAEKLKSLEDIIAAAPDSKLYEVPVIKSASPERSI